MADIVPEGATPETLRQRIRARFLRIHSARLDGRKAEDCLKDAYDACAEELDRAGQELTETLVNEDIPAWVFRGCVEHQWIRYPLLRWMPGGGNFLEGWFRQSRYERIAESELKETFAGYKVTEGFREWFKGLLASPIARWQSEVWTRAAAAPKPRQSDEAEAKAGSGPAPTVAQGVSAQEAAPIERVAQSEQTAPKKRGRKRRFTADQLQRAHEMKEAGKRNNEVAKVLYETAEPTAAQRRSVSTTLNYHFRSKK